MEDYVKFKLAEQKRHRRKESLLAIAMMSPYLIIFIIFTVVPVIMGVVFSFMRYNPYSGEENAFYGFQNYINLFNFDLPISKSFWGSFTTMFVFDLVAVPCLIVIPLILAYFINKRPPGYKVFRAIIYIPSVVSVSIMGIIFGNMFEGTESGLINAWLGTKIEWLSGSPWHGDTLRWLVMLIASIWWGSGMNFVIFSGALRNVPKSLYEACEMDGGNKIKQIMYVMLPNIKSAVMVCLFNTLISYLGLYGQPYVLNDVTNENILVSPMMFIQKYLMGGIVYARQTGFLCAAGVMFGLVVIVFSTIQRVLTMSDRRRKSKHTNGCNEFYACKAVLREDGSVAPIQRFGGEL